MPLPVLIFYCLLLLLWAAWMVWVLPWWASVLGGCALAAAARAEFRKAVRDTRR